jgi:phosphoribosyl 1,2-cyclic phosphate phosphodiesterase
MIFFNMRKRINVWADQSTQNDLVERFKYAFVQPDDSPYPPILNLNTLDGITELDGDGGPINFVPFQVKHGNVSALGFRIGPLVYLPDVSEMSKEAWDEVKKAKCWILDALRRNPHPSHSHLENSLEWIKKSRIEKAVLTNMHVDLDYETLMNETPKNVEPAFDGMVLDFEFAI